MNPRFERIIYTVDNKTWHWAARDNDGSQTASGIAESRAEAVQKTLSFARDALAFAALMAAKANVEWEPFNA